MADPDYNDDYDYDYPEGPRRLRAPLIIFVSIVLLRLAVGWHFFREGTKKLDVDRSTGAVSVGFAGTEGFLRGAVGPVGDLAQSQLPGFHNWEQLLGAPAFFSPQTPEQQKKRADWLRDYELRRKEGEDKNKKRAELDDPLQPISIEFPPDAAYLDFAKQVASDWLEVQKQFAALPGLSEAQRAASAEAYQTHKQQLANYLEGIEQEILEWRHELWRPQQWEEEPGAEELPFEKTRIAEARAEAQRKALPWIAQMRALEQHYYNDLRRVAAHQDPAEQPAEETLEAAARKEASAEKLQRSVESIVDDDRAQRLRYADIGVTFLTIGVGVCLMLGLFTRLASLLGAGFLLAVMATQPPWIEGASTQFFYYQLVEFAAFFVLMATAAGRFAGLDFFIHSLLSRRGRRKEA